ncbi:hypothetical protein K1T71_006628 [Dendrolimus kikuchii]|uniref:Uncharacterized protein n=1 Tax=Dendrolimus kikuchii TaxID=765133 RepID=A0ACC1D202_9NEOP|nr:hypothetical protein K1T71_006628 [Dendrolimus kikuchii]
MNRIDSILVDYDVLQTEIESLSDNPDEQLTERGHSESQFYSAMSLARTMLAPGHAQLRAGSVATGDDTMTSRHQDFVRLPKIDLPHFDGDYQHWLGFRDTYLSLIHNNNSLSDIHKFHYLRAALQGSAALLIQSLDLRKENYAISWQLLSERYDNQKLLVNNHLQALFNLQNIQRENGSLLRNMVDTINKNLRALATLGEPTDHWDTIIIFIMSKKLDNASSRQWEEYRNTLAGNNSPSLQQFLKFLNNRADLLDTVQEQNVQASQSNNTKGFIVTSNNITSTYKNKPNYTKNPMCPMCSDSHFLFACPTFKTLSVDLRIKKVTEARVCKNCLRPGHIDKNCRLSHCKYCQLKHNTLLHKEVGSETRPPPSLENNVALSSNIALPSSNRGLVLLSTALVKVRDIHGHPHAVRLLLDNGSTSNFVTQHLCEKLGLVRRNTSSTVSGINNSLSYTTESCNLTIESYYGDYRLNINCHVLPELTKSLPSTYFDTSILHLPVGIHLADPSCNVPSPIDILVGAEVFWDVLTSNHIDLGKKLPKLHESKLGWLISGCINQLHNKRQLCNFTATQDALLSRFWELDSVSSKHCLSYEERACEQNFIDTTKRADNGQFVVTMPLKDSPEVLGDSYTHAKLRFLSLERRFERDINFKHKYSDFIREYIDLGHMTVNQHKSTTNQPQYYLPHHGVLRELSSTTKLRVVFDASAASTSGKSFNSIQMVGPTVQDDLLSILLRFRQHKFVVTSDIEKMYRAVLIEPSQRSLQQIIFRFDQSDPLKTYTLNTVTYGCASAPYLATKCLVSLADESSDPSVKNAIKNNFYVDDFLYSGPSIESVVNICKGVIHTLQSAKFNLRKWQSNSQEILSSISNIKGDSEKALNLDNTMCKTLGLHWLTESDQLFFFINIDVNIKVTKRNILSIISQVFDPLGLIGPCIVLFKIIIQKLWLNKCDWDDEIPLDIKKEYLSSIKSLSSLNNIKIPRWFSNIHSFSTEIHTFTDASERAYGACVYIRNVGEDGTICVRLLNSKNRVAPIKPTTIPKLELCGALLGTRLCRKVQNSLTIPISRCYFWSDSTIVLGWLSMPSNRLKHFVRNRVNEIQDTTHGQTWSYVPSKDNPADLVSRGAQADLLSSSTLWWSGPTFLQHKEIKFFEHPNIHSNSLPEISLHTHTNTIENTNTILQLINRTSNFIKLIRIFTYIQRFINKCKQNKTQYKNHLTCIELQTSKLKLISIAQQDMFPNEFNILISGKSLHIKNRLASLSPFMDNNHSVIRVGGRLKNSYYSYDIKHPILLCSKHHLTKIIFGMQHKLSLHAGPQLLLAQIRQTYWPLGGRNIARATVHACIRCMKFNVKPVQPIMGNLPMERLHLEYPFLNSGTDYMGPVLMLNRKGRGARLLKCYICIFVCLATKAVHLEVATDLTTEAFIACLNRFVARRGMPQTVYSDNGTNFVGACNQLSSFLKGTSSTLSSEAAMKGICFKFIPAYAPAWGGLWESAVKSVKHHLRRILGLSHLTYEELATCLAQIEAILNSRPLVPLSSDPCDLSYLTPSHFLIGRSLTSIPQADIETNNINSLQRFQRVQKLKQHFWNRFSKEYVSCLQQKTRWRASSGALRVGEMVLVEEPNTPPLLWLVGRIVRVMPGQDGVARMAEIKTKRGLLIRTAHRLCPLNI